MYVLGYFFFAWHEYRHLGAFCVCPSNSFPNSLTRTCHYKHYNKALSTPHRYKVYRQQSEGKQQSSLLPGMTHKMAWTITQKLCNFVDAKLQHTRWFKPPSHWFCTICANMLLLSMDRFVSCKIRLLPKKQNITKPPWVWKEWAQSVYILDSPALYTPGWQASNRLDWKCLAQKCLLSCSLGSIKRFHVWESNLTTSDQRQHDYPKAILSERFIYIPSWSCCWVLRSTPISNLLFKKLSFLHDLMV